MRNGCGEALGKGGSLSRRSVGLSLQMGMESGKGHGGRSLPDRDG